MDTHERSALRWATRGIIGFVLLLMVIGGIVGSGPGAGLLLLGLTALFVGAGAALTGRARWAFIPSRKTASVVAGVGLVALIVGGVTMPPTKHTPTAVAAPAKPTASAADPSLASSEKAIQAAENRLFTDQAAKTTSASNVDATTLLSDDTATQSVTTAVTAHPTSALAALSTLTVKGRAPMTGYSRTQFGDGWVDVDHNGCDTRNDILARDLTGNTFKPGTHNCIVLTGTLADPYSGKTINFTRGVKTSQAVQIDHVVALGDAWQTGAQGWDAAKRTAFANDPRELLAVDGPLNEAKGDGDAATWLPPNRADRCDYVARQVAVKVAYGLWMTQAEKTASATVLATCPDQALPNGVVANVVAPAPLTTSAPAPAPVVVAPVPVPVPAPAPAPKPAPAPAPAPKPAPQPAPAPKPAPAPAPAPKPAPQPAPAPAPAPAGTHTAGKFCKQADEGKIETATNGATIQCQDYNNDGHPHWKAI